MKTKNQMMSQHGKKAYPEISGVVILTDFVGETTQALEVFRSGRERL